MRAIFMAVVLLVAGCNERPPMPQTEGSAAPNAESAPRAGSSSQP